MQTIERQPLSRRPGFSRLQAPDEHGFDLRDVPPALRALLVADGTVTLLLEALFWEPVGIRVLEQTVVQELPFDRSYGAEEMVAHRDVVLVGTSGRLYGFARSRILLERLDHGVRAALLAKSIGIGALLRAQRVETYREMTSIVAREAGGDAAALTIDADAAVVERTYRIRGKGTPLMEISEVFPVELYRLRA